MKTLLFSFGAIIQLLLFRVMARSLFSTAAAKNVTYSLLANICAAVFGGAIFAWLIGRLIKRVRSGPENSTRNFLAVSGLFGILATTITYELLIFSISASIMDQSRNNGQSFFAGGLFLTVLSLHAYTVLSYVPIAGLGCLSGMVVAWFVSKLSETKSTTGGPLLRT